MLTRQEMLTADSILARVTANPGCPESWYALNVASPETFAVAVDYLITVGALRSSVIERDGRFPAVLDLA